MGLVLTQSAYAAYVQLLGPRSKEAITLTALATGLSSTVFIPLGFFLIEKFGWRHALLWLAGINLLCTLIHIVTVRRPLSESTEPEIAITTPSTTLRKIGRASCRERVCQYV